MLEKDIDQRLPIVRLVGAELEGIMTDRPLTPTTSSAVPAGPPPACPYRGLFAFQETDAPFFFGREAFTRQLVAAVQRQALAAVIGSSGSGKSSVAFAGLVAHLRQEQGWLIEVFRPGSDPFQSLAATLLPLLEPELSETSQLVETRKLAKSLSAGELPLADVVGRVLQKSSGTTRFLLVADQFEELYTLCRGPRHSPYLSRCVVRNHRSTASTRPAPPSFWSLPCEPIFWNRLWPIVPLPMPCKITISSWDR